METEKRGKCYPFLVDIEIQLEFSNILRESKLLKFNKFAFFASHTSSLLFSSFHFLFLFHFSLSFFFYFSHFACIVHATNQMTTKVCEKSSEDR